MLFLLEFQTEIALVNACMVSLTTVCTVVRPTLNTTQLTLRAHHLTQPDISPQVHNRILEKTFQLVDARVDPATSTDCLKS